MEIKLCCIFGVANQPQLVFLEFHRGVFFVESISSSFLSGKPRSMYMISHLLRREKRACWGPGCDVFKNAFG